MKKLTLIAVAVCALALTSEDVFARGGHSGKSKGGHKKPGHSHHTSAHKHGNFKKHHKSKGGHKKAGHSYHASAHKHGDFKKHQSNENVANSSKLSDSRRAQLRWIVGRLHGDNVMAIRRSLVRLAYGNTLTVGEVDGILKYIGSCDCDLAEDESSLVSDSLENSELAEDGSRQGSESPEDSDDE